MIRLDNISKQNGHQILFIEASAALQKGEKVGLVGPNGSGKTTLFRLITGEDVPDEGQVAVDRGVTIGYFSQDVGEMSGRSAVSEVMDGAGPVAEVATELKELEHAMADLSRADEMTDIIARYKKMRGCNVLHPMGWDAFGLPAEQYAIKTGQHPSVTTKENVGRFREQLLFVYDQVFKHRRSLGEHVIDRDTGVGEDDALGSGM